MSQEDIYEVERMEKDALEAYEWLQQNPGPTWRELAEGYIQDLDARIKALEEQ